MATFGQYAASKIIELRKQISQLDDELEEMESDLSGGEITHPKYFYAMIDFIDGDDVYLYTEDEEGESEDILITFDELVELLNQEGGNF